MSHFKVLPTSEDYLKMPFQWMEYLFLNFLSNADYDQIRDRYRENNAKEKDNFEIMTEVNNITDVLIEELGYSKEEAECMKDDLRSLYR